MSKNPRTAEEQNNINQGVDPKDPRKLIDNGDADAAVGEEGLKEHQKKNAQQSGIATSEEVDEMGRPRRSDVSRDESLKNPQ